MTFLNLLVLVLAIADVCHRTQYYEQVVEGSKRSPTRHLPTFSHLAANRAACSLEHQQLDSEVRTKYQNKHVALPSISVKRPTAMKHPITKWPSGYHISLAHIWFVSGSNLGHEVGYTG
jgi:hypothetical protein